MAHNAACLRGALEAWNDGGLRAISDGWWDDDILWCDLPDLPDPLTIRGRAAVEARIEEMIAAIGHWHFEIASLEEFGDLTLAELELVGHGVRSGAGFIGRIHQIQRWRDQRAVEVRTYAERDAAVAALHELSGGAHPAPR